jgi:glycosyltransferase involved in cell wall biosynthesis
MTSGELTASIEGWPPSPEPAALADGLARILGVEVRPWWGTPEVAALSQFRSTLSPDDVAVICAAAAPGASRPALAEALIAAEAAGLDVAWAGLARNGFEDIRRETPLIVAATDRREEVRELLATGTASLLFDPAILAAKRATRPVRVCVASYEVVGPTKNGGIGTANTSLAEALAVNGHEVTLLYTGWQALTDEGRRRWRRHYERRGIEFRELGDEIKLEVDTPHFNQGRAYEVYRWLKRRSRNNSWDVVHLPECQGHGYYALLAHRQGLAFPDSTFVVGVHSPTRWVYEANRWTLESAHRLADDFMERRCVELADVVVSPSAYLLAWMELKGWALPERRFVQQYATSGAVSAVSVASEEDDLDSILPEGPGTRAARELGYSYKPNGPLHAAPPTDAVAVEEIVFFGRLETRKGLAIFCDALDILAEDPELAGLRVTFMGSETRVGGVPAGEYLRARGRRWPWSWRVDGDRNQLEAVAYIREPARLAIMPSPVDNSPNTVLEALGLGIPFITSRGGGIPELIEPLDHEAATFDPAEPRLAGASLGAAIRRAIAGGGPVRPRFAVNPEANQRVHVLWHERIAASLPRPGQDAEQIQPAQLSVCLAADGSSEELLQRLARSLEDQEPKAGQMVIALPGAPAAEWHDDARPRLHERGWQIVEGELERLDSIAAAAASGEWLVLCEPYVVARPGMLAGLLAAASRTGADLVTSAASYTRAEVDDPGWRGDVPLGASSVVGIFYDCFGVGGCLIRRQVFESLGGFAMDGPPAVRRRDLLCRAALAGVRATVVPEPLLDCDREAAERIALSPDEIQLRALEAYRKALPSELADLPDVALSLSLMPPVPVPDAGESERVRMLEESLQAITRSHSWRMTRFLRQGMDRLRRLR